MVKDGAPISIIVDEIAPLGPPEKWIREQIRELRKSRHLDPTKIPDLEVEKIEQAR
jgi:hypothetical protein